jgi:hypothetical protein
MSDIIVMGIGPDSTVEEFLLFGLTSPDAPSGPSLGTLAQTGMSAMSGGSDDMEIG